MPPFFFGGFGEDDDYAISPSLFWAYRTKHRFRLVVPPLLSSYTQDGDNVAVWALNTYFASRENGFSFVFAPFLFMGENGLSHHTFVPPLFWRWGEGLDTTTIVANAFFHETPERWDFGVVPLYFKGESLKHGAYDVSPPLFWSFRNGPEQTLVLPPLLTNWEQRKAGHTFAQVPFFFDGREGAQATRSSDDGRTLAGHTNTSPALIDLEYREHHAAGVLEHHLGRRPGRAPIPPERAAELRAWAAGLLARPWPRWQ